VEFLPAQHHLGILTDPATFARIIRQFLTAHLERFTRHDR